MTRSTLYTLLTILFFTQCSLTTEPIQYGIDSCHFCRMTIVDQQHASQIVTKKGRNYKYDAIECMVQSLPDWQSNEINTYLISDYNSPGKMINALEAKYLISESIPSPMGAFLSGFDTESQRDTFVKLETDRRLSWTEMKVDIQK